MTNQAWLETAIQTLMAEKVGRSEVGRSEAHLSARLLLDGATGLRYSHLIAPDEILEFERMRKLQQELEDASRGRPIPYILGKAPFWGRDFGVDERVLIPRPETELLVETTLELLGDGLKSRGAKVADLGTGSGVIAVSLKLERPDLEVFGMDISGGALEVAARNAAKHGVKVGFLRGTGDWLAPLEGLALLRAIVSNPPYIAAAEIEKLEVGVRDFEPRLALNGGEDGLEPYREMAKGAAELLEEAGFVAVELGMGQFEAIRAIFEAQGWQVETARRDLAGIERVLVARLAH